MLALQITSLKIMMNQLLAGDAFDIFLLEEATVSTANTVTIDGHINKEFYPEEERGTDRIPYDFQPWNEIKGMCFNLIKGKHTPLFFKFVFLLKPEKAAALLAKHGASAQTEALKALVLTLRYDGSQATLTTGTSYRTFVLSREADEIWDRAITGYLQEKGIAFEILT